MLPPANVKLPWSGGGGDSNIKVAFVATSAAFGALIILLIVLLAFVVVRRRRRSRDNMLSEVRWLFKQVCWSAHTATSGARAVPPECRTAFAHFRGAQCFET